MKDCRSQCPVNYALELFGDTWTLLIIRDMIFLKKSTYTEFQKSPEGIATNILANRLGKLEEADIITKETDPENSKKYIYTLTNKGIDLLPILIEMITWGVKYDKNTAAPKHIVKRLKNDKENFIKEIQASLKK